MPTKGESKGLAWIHAHLNYQGDDCLQWPFSRTRGYGAFGINRKPHYAHRVMCELVYGPAPSPKHQASHNCGRGHEGCVNPRHLAWKTPSENQLDRRRHGTARINPYGNRSHLTVSQWREIQNLRGVNQDIVAQRFGISRRHVRRIQQVARGPVDPRHKEPVAGTEQT